MDTDRKFCPATRRTTPRSKRFLEKLEARRGKAQRVWLNDRGIPTEVVLEPMRASTPPVSYLVGTPKGK